MKAIFDRNGHIKTSTQQILKEQVSFYQNLYTSNPKVSFHIDTKPEKVID